MNLFPRFFLLIALTVTGGSHATEISRAFEVRYVTADPAANGETDFKGDTSIFDTDQRVDFLRQYERAAARFFKNPDWDRRVVEQGEIDVALARIKPQPLPEVRTSLPLTRWRFLGHRPGQREEEGAALAQWKTMPGLRIEDGAMVVVDGQARIEKTFAPQAWRFRLEWRVMLPAASGHVALAVDDIAEVGIGADGRSFFRTPEGVVKGPGCVPGVWHLLELEIDLEHGRYNFLVDGTVTADFVPITGRGPARGFRVTATPGARLDDICGVGYTRAFDPATTNTNDRDIPFHIRTFIDEDFSVRPDPEGWATLRYDDSAWAPVPQWPYAHGGERHAGETLYLRTKVRLPAAIQRAELACEALDPSGEIWVNGRPVEVRRDRHPFAIDITPYLVPDTDNLIAIRVDPFQVKRTMRHTAADPHTGWAAGRIRLNLTAQRWIKDAFVRTESLADGNACVRIRALLRNDEVLPEANNEPKIDNAFNGRLSVAFFPWYPEEGSRPAATLTRPVRLDLGRDFEWEETLTMERPALWSPDHPQLYKVSVRLEREDGAPIDDVVFTTGVRTVNQDGGTFRLNGQPAMMNGALLFGYRPPLQRIAQWLRTPPDEWLVHDLLMLKKLEANTARITVHDGPVNSVNDPRYAEIGDQIGVMFQWATTAWVRTNSPYQLDFEGLAKYVRQVRNHPSIVMWQPGNHPRWFTQGFEAGLEWLEKVHRTIYTEDPSRLISPTARFFQTHSDDGTRDLEGNRIEPNPAWTLPMLVRGDMDHMTGYGAEWRQMRLYPRPDKYQGDMGGRQTGFREEYLASKARAYFDFESEESAAQPNWTLLRGTPFYRIRSYEIGYDVKSIGRQLTFEEWRESQAWQAMSGYEAYRKKRWLDYDGLAWCSIDGGANTGTYEKPLTDYYRNGKISFYAVKMAFQPVLSGSGNVDVAYGPADTIPVIVLNLGPERVVDVTLRVLDQAGGEVARRTFSAVRLASGRTRTDLGAVRFAGMRDGFHTFEYVVTKNQTE